MGLAFSHGKGWKLFKDSEKVNDLGGSDVLVGSRAVKRWRGRLHFGLIL